MLILLCLPGLIYIPVIALGVTPFMMRSFDFPSLGVRTFPGSSPAGHAKAKALFHGLMPALERWQQECLWVLEELGLEEGKAIPHWTERFQLPKAHLQMCIQSLELPRTDMSRNVQFIGGREGVLPASDVDVWVSKPEWWAELEENERKKNVVGITQGMMTFDYTELIIPTIEALRDKPDTIAVVDFGWRGATLLEEMIIPTHIHVIAYIPYTGLLKYLTLFITNDGYNGVQQALSQGNSILKADNDGDKLPTRNEWAGCGVDL